jgi:hypothetical protein
MQHTDFVWGDHTGPILVKELPGKLEKILIDVHDTTGLEGECGGNMG